MPANVSSPATSGSFGADRTPVARTRNRASTVSPPSVVTRQPLERSSHRAADDAGVELDVAAQPEAIGDVVGVAQDLGLGGVALGPVPLLLELGRERVGVVERLDVAACAGIAVPPPRATDVAGRLEATDVESEPLEAVDRVHPGEPGADDDHVEAIHDEILSWR